MTAPEAHPTVATGRVLGGRYRLVEIIAAGGMADVWEGVDEVLTRAVAVKVLRAHLAADRDFRERFRREAVAAARLSHPAIVATYDAGTDEEVTYIVMELVRGRTLSAALAAKGALPPAAAVGVALQVTGALAHAHAAGICHRDIKPSNILLCDSIAPGRVKIADFGIAKAAGTDEADLTQTGAIVGTARYLAPEQVDGREADARADLYSVGAVLFEMLSGRAPFERPTELATALAHVHDPPPRLRRLRSGIPRPLEALTLRLLAKDPGARYQSADELRQALDAIDVEIDDAEPMPLGLPTPPGGVTVSPRPARRIPTPLAVVALVAVAAIVVAVFALRTEKSGAPGGARSALVVDEVTSFDPEGSDKSENERDARLTIDGDRNTVWQTDRYRSRAFGNLKQGVGLVFTLSGPAKVGQLEAISTSQDWGASIYVSDSAPGNLAGWGEPVAAERSLSDRATFNLAGREGTAVLLWITDPGSENRAVIAEVTLSG